MEAANASDRAAKYQLKKKLGAQATYQSASKDQQEARLAIEWERVSASRFESCQSGMLLQYIITYLYWLDIAEWLERQLQDVHKKWDDIERQVDMRKHSTTLKKLDQATQDAPTKQMGSRAAERLYGSGCIWEKLTRNEYREGLQKLNTNSFESQAAKEEWEKFRDSLSPNILAMVSAPSWQ